MKNPPYLEAEKKIAEALKSGGTELDLRSMKLTELPESIGQLTQLTSLDSHHQPTDGVTKILLRKLTRTYLKNTLVRQKSQIYRGNLPI